MKTISHTEEYTTPLCKFKNFTQLGKEEKELVLEWRNCDSIRAQMYNKGIIPIESHLAFIRKLENREDVYYWLVYNDKGTPIGVFDVTRVDKEKDFVEVGYYLSPKRLGDGLKLLKECLYLTFNVLDIANVFFGVYETNKDGRILDEFLGCVFDQEEVINGDKYLISTNLSKEVFNEHYKLGLADFLKFVKSNK